MTESARRPDGVLSRWPMGGAARLGDLMHGYRAARPGVAAASGSSPLSWTVWLATVAALYVVYSLSYLGTDPTPGNPALPLGWLGWFDQSNYLAQSRSFADGTWRTAYQYYPPLYPWLGSWFIGFWPAHPYYLIDFVGLTLHVVSVISIGRRYFGTAAPFVSLVSGFAFFTFISLDQWEVPWTTSVSAGLGAILLLTFDRFSRRGWSLVDAGDWALLATYSVCYGALAGTRPLDTVVWLPAGLIFYTALLRREANPFRPGFKPLRTAGIVALVALCGLLVPALYIAFNLANTGTFEGTYITVQRGGGYILHGFLRKFISLIFDSGTIYVEPDAALADRFWPVYVAFPLVIYYACRATSTLRVVAITLIAQYAVYVPFGDLLPNGLYRFFNVHYFAWTIPWLILLCLGFIRSFVVEPRPSWRGVGVVALLSALCWLVSLRAVPVALGRVQALSKDAVDIAFPTPQRVDFIDLSGATATWPELYLALGANQLDIDDQRMGPVKDYRLWPIDGGVRITFPKTTTGEHFVLHINPAGQVTPSQLAARAARVAVSFACRFSDCALPPLPSPPPPMADLPATFDLGSGGDARPYLREGWASAEAWGRWTTYAEATLTFGMEAPRPLAVSAEVRPLVSAQRPRQTVTLMSGGCRIAEATFQYPADAQPRVLQGDLPASCLQDDKQVRLTFATDRVLMPQSIGIGDDVRTLGVGVAWVKVH